MISIVIIILIINVIPKNSNFNRNIWLNNIDKRKEMINDLTNKWLPQRNKIEIISLLGEPNKNYFKNADLVYTIGKEKSLFSIDYEWLLIYLDNDEKYFKFEIKTD